MAFCRARWTPRLPTRPGRKIRIIPSPERLFESAGTEGGDDSRWQLLFWRLRESVTLEEAEELIRAVEYERRRKR